MSFFLLPLRSGTYSSAGEYPSCYPSHPSVDPLVVMLHPVCGGRIVAFIDYFVIGSVAVASSPTSPCYAQPVA